MARGAGWAGAGAAGLGALGVYGRTLYAGVSGGDATELVFNACQGSVAHPPATPPSRCWGRSLCGWCRRGGGPPPGG